MRKKIFIMIFFIMSVVFIDIVKADIYMYKDKNGVLHFTNIPNSSKYRPYVSKKKRAKYSSFYSNSNYSNSKYDNLIQQASSRHDISFPLIKAIIKVESDFNPHAVSKAGALGLMQIMPENLKPLKINDPFNPWENVMGGTMYLKELLNRFQGKLELALAAYNAGPSAVERYNNIPPFKETQNYVKKVMNFYRHLQH